MGDKALKEQFQLLQEQKKKRLMKRKELKSSESDQKTTKCSPDKQADLLQDVEEDLGLQLSNHGTSNICDTDDYKDIQETVRELRDENGRLDKLLGEKEEEIKIVRRRWKAEREELAGGGVGSGNAASKIIEFSKKIRELNTTVEKERTRSQTLEKKLRLMEESCAPAEIKAPLTPSETDNLQTELTSTKEKLSNALMKLAETRSDMETQKKDLKVAQKVLAREVGENVTFQSLINGSAGWRGRQQQILALQLKVDELQQQVDERTQSATATASSRNALLNGLSQHDEKHRLAMRKIELERKEMQEKVQKELEQIRTERDSFKEKNGAARARNKIITQDLKNIREQLVTLTEKGKRDDELVSALLREQQYLKEENEKLKGDLEDKKSTHRVLRASGDFQTEKPDNDALVLKLKDEIHIQEERVKELEEEMASLRNARSSRHSQIPRPMSSSSSPGGRLLQRRDSASQNHLPLDLKLQESRSLCEVANVEKERLNELVQVLQRRNEELVKEVLDKDFLLNEYKNSNSALQRQVEKLTFSLNNVNARGGPGSKSGKKKGIDDEKSSVREVETKLAIQCDNNDALKGALEETLKAKEDDSKYYQQIIEQTKNIFLQGLRQYKETQEGR